MMDYGAQAISMSVGVVFLLCSKGVATTGF